MPRRPRAPTGHYAGTNEGLSASHYELRYTKQLFTPKGSKKPDTAVLNAIISDLGLAKGDCVYVGDNLAKDVAMALDCEVEDVWAEYGQAHKRPEYKLLQDVTHWTPEEVKREQQIKAREHVHPTHTLANSFSQILDHFEFKDFHDERPKLTDENKKQIIDIWKTIVGVQQHFNDIEMRIRAMFVTIILALFASVGFLMDKKLSFVVWVFNVQFATLVPLIGVLGACLFYFMDRYWYHRLLLGAVNHAIGIEKPDHLALELRDLQLLRLHLTLAGKRMLRIIRKRFHLTAQL